MKFAVCVFLLCCLAMASAAPQLLTTWPGFGAGWYTHGLYNPGTVVAGPTVVNGITGLTTAGRIITPGVITPTIY